jgi:hypothetical protein
MKTFVSRGPAFQIAEQILAGEQSDATGEAQER